MIKLCISSPCFSVLVNGVPCPNFIPSCGILLDDPLSPYIFILYGELLARQFFLASSHQDKLVEVSIGNSGVSIMLLNFADDSMIFAKVNDKSCFAISPILDKYCYMSGTLVNYHKSAFQVSPNVAEEKRLILLVF